MKGLNLLWGLLVSSVCSALFALLCAPRCHEGYPCLAFLGERNSENRCGLFSGVGVAALAVVFEYHARG